MITQIDLSQLGLLTLQLIVGDPTEATRIVAAESSVRRCQHGQHALQAGQRLELYIIMRPTIVVLRDRLR